MEDERWIDAVRQNPITGYITGFHAMVERMGVHRSADLKSLSPIKIKSLALLLLSSLSDHPAAELLQEIRGRKASDEWWSGISTTSTRRLRHLLARAVQQVDDEDIWKQVKKIFVPSTPSPPASPIAAPWRRRPTKVTDTPFSYHTGNLTNTKELHKDIDPLLKKELGISFIDIAGFLETFVPASDKLKKVSKDFFDRCNSDRTPTYKGDLWTKWPKSAAEKHVLEKFARPSRPAKLKLHRRRLLGTPNKIIHGSIAKRKLDIGLMYQKELKRGTKEGKHHFSQVLMAGELKSNPKAHRDARLSLAMYLRETLAEDATRRFAMGFTICGSLIRVWVFDRIGSTASRCIDINGEPLQFIEVMLGFIWMSEEGLGIDPTIQKIDGEQFIEIERNGRSECIVIDWLIMRTRCIVGRATTCWKGHVKGHPEIPVIIKDTWSSTERDEEGEMLKQATSQNVVNVARYYHHETVKIGGMIDDVRNCVRRGLDITTASNYQKSLSKPSRGATTKAFDDDQTGSPLPSSSSDSESFGNIATDQPTEPTNRVHRRVIVQDFGKPIYTASSLQELLACLEGCIEGHQSLYDIGVLHRDISINNLMINEDPQNPSQRYFLIDLDLAINTKRKQPSGALGRSVTRAFIAIGLLYPDVKHSFAHDLESFFWVLFWICIHYDGPNKVKTPSRFECWNYLPNVQLAEAKLGIASGEKAFFKAAEPAFTPYYQPLIPHVNALRKELFPEGDWQDEGSPQLYSKVLRVLRRAQKDPKVTAE
ncbi:hypothetical protein E4U31_007005 [Claviceps sp. LM219 group G6]|nr:hypothetical protein E4U31_007005 [Claviceps sp. LM219 group G6]